MFQYDKFFYGPGVRAIKANTEDPDQSGRLARHVG